jgi:hypothetical protein
VGAAVLNNTRAQAALPAPTPQVIAPREIISDLMDIPDVKDYLGRMLSGVGVFGRWAEAPLGFDEPGHAGGGLRGCFCVGHFFRMIT